MTLTSVHADVYRATRVGAHAITGNIASPDSTRFVFLHNEFHNGSWQQSTTRKIARWASAEGVGQG